MKNIAVSIILFFVVAAIISIATNHKDAPKTTKCLEYTGFYYFNEHMPESYKVFCEPAN